MANVGSIDIVGTIDVESIKLGLQSMRQGLNRARESAKGAFGDITRVGSAVSAIAEPLVKIGAAIGASFMGLATMAPQIAPHLERMKTDFFRLSTIVGEVFEPVFNSMANAFSSFVAWMGSPQGQGILEGVKGIVSGLASGISDLFSSLSTLAGMVFGFDVVQNLKVTLGDNLTKIVDYFGPEVLAFIFGWKLTKTPVGGAVAAGGVALARGLGKFGEEQTFGTAAKTVGGGALLGGALGGWLGALLGGLAGAGLETGKYLRTLYDERKGDNKGPGGYQSEQLYEQEMDDWNNYKNMHLG